MVVGKQRRVLTLIVFIGICAQLGVIGCAAKITQPELVAHLRSVAGGNRAVRVIPIHADTRIEALARLGEARTDPRASLSRDLGQQLRMTRTRRITFVVGGPFADLADQVVVNALQFNQGIALPGLTLVFVAPEPPSDTLKQAVASRRARLFHKPLVL